MLFFATEQFLLLFRSDAINYTQVWLFFAGWIYLEMGNERLVVLVGAPTAGALDEFVTSV